MRYDEAICRLREKPDKVLQFSYTHNSLGRTQHPMQGQMGSTRVGHEEEEGTVGQHLYFVFYGKERVRQGKQA